MSRFVRPKKTPQISNRFLGIPEKPLWAPAEPHGEKHKTSTPCVLAGTVELLEFRAKVVEFLMENKVSKIKKFFEKNKNSNIAKDYNNTSSAEYGTLKTKCDQFIRDTFNEAVKNTLNKCGAHTGHTHSLHDLTRKLQQHVGNLAGPINKYEKLYNELINVIEHTRAVNIRKHRRGSKQKKAAEEEHTVKRKKIMEAVFFKKFGDEHKDQIYEWLKFFYNNSDENKLIKNLSSGDTHPFTKIQKNTAKSAIDGTDKEKKIFVKGLQKLTCELFLEKFKNYDSLNAVMEALKFRFPLPMTPRQRGFLNTMKIHKKKFSSYSLGNEIDSDIALNFAEEIRRK